MIRASASAPPICFLQQTIVLHSPPNMIRPLPTRIGARLLSIALLVGFLPAVSHSLRFELQSGQTKCISEDMRSNSMTVGKYSVVNPLGSLPLDDSHKLSLRVTIGITPCDLCVVSKGFAG